MNWWACFFQLEKFEPQEAATEIKDLIGPQGSVKVLPKTRTLYVTDTGGAFADNPQRDRSEWRTRMDWPRGGWRATNSRTFFPTRGWSFCGS